MRTVEVRCKACGAPICEVFTADDGEVRVRWQRRNREWISSLQRKRAAGQPVRNGTEKNEKHPEEAPLSAPRIVIESWCQAHGHITVSVAQLRGRHGEALRTPGMVVKWSIPPS